MCEERLFRYISARPALLLLCCLPVFLCNVSLPPTKTCSTEELSPSRSLRSVLLGYAEIPLVNVYGMLPVCLLLIQIASVLIAMRMATAKLACQDSGYCSLGALAPFVGDVYPSNCRSLMITDAARSHPTHPLLSAQVQNCTKHSSCVATRRKSS